MWWNNGVGWGSWVVMTVAMVAFWGLVIVGIVALFRDGGRDDRLEHSRYRRSPEQILDERFARGEIDLDEYHARRSVLHSAR